MCPGLTLSMVGPREWAKAHWFLDLAYLKSHGEWPQKYECGIVFSPSDQIPIGSKRVRSFCWGSEESNGEPKTCQGLWQRRS